MFIINKKYKYIGPDHLYSNRFTLYSNRFTVGETIIYLGKSGLDYRSTVPLYQFIDEAGRNIQWLVVNQVEPSIVIKKNLKLA